ncbi:Prolyl oligopeptidase family protein [Chitinophaga sp. YR627]|uniref:alpha/beta hydrolase family protein n=1 Tax=Chitinophaga sp. YR627 TaxID=1881041 RepID=UPI0008E2C44F|nr:prolyl oligopeptidase family serine peptidase [Chitinophaga sp. YR627]SFM79356.1 Prolyl oligopeptidase family protein [Chitinophaga sp. YR627]
MKTLFFTHCLLYLVFTSYAQKPPLRIDTFKSWPSIGYGNISNDGRYVCYNMQTGHEGETKTVVRATQTGWQIQFDELTDPVFDNRSNMLFAISRDTLLKLDLTTKKVSFVPDVSSFKLLEAGQDLWLLQRPAQNNTLSIIRFRDNKKISLDSISDFVVSHNQQYLLLRQLNNKHIERLVLVSLIDAAYTTVFNGFGINNIIFDNIDQQFAFWTDSSQLTQLWIGKTNIGIPSCLYSERQKDRTNNNAHACAGSSFKFSSNNHYLFLTLQQSIKPAAKNPNLVISSYHDAILKTADFKGTNINDTITDLLARISLNNKEIITLTQANDETILETPREQTPDDYIIIRHQAKDSTDQTYTDAYNYFLCSVASGKRFPVKLNSPVALKSMQISPGGKYLVYYDPSFSAYYSISLSDMQCRKILSNETESLLDFRLKDYPKSQYPVGIAGWLSDDKHLLINGTYNIYLVDPAARQQSVNLTADLQQHGHIIYHLPLTRYRLLREKDDTFLLSALNLDNKMVAFQRWKPGSVLNPRDIHFIPAYIGNLKLFYPQLDREIRKAGDKSRYLLRMESAGEAPNLYLTADFKNFKPLSNINPQRKYNWLTSELHKYHDSRGYDLEGILYKPENFDSTKVYPLIINIYEQKSIELNKYEAPGNGSGGDIDLSRLVSNGYIVFKANIMTEHKKPGEGSLTSVLAAVNHLKKYKWIDTSKMAITGHSFGGYEVNYIITHSNIFAAAVSAAGVASIIESYSTPVGTAGTMWDGYIKDGPPKVVSSLSDSTDLYVQNSPIFYARNITTPLLMMHNTEDGNVLFSQGLSFFAELKRLRKKVWMLTYRGDRHVVSEVNQIDYYTRLSEFLDYYLKNKKMPSWMDGTNRY